MSNPFEAAQQIILSYLALIPKDEDVDGYAQCIAAYRVLEAAAKVSGDTAVKVWDWLHSESAICPPWVNQENSRAIRALLAALPSCPTGSAIDGEGGGKK